MQSLVLPEERTWGSLESKEYKEVIPLETDKKIVKTLIDRLGRFFEKKFPSNKTYNNWWKKLREKELTACDCSLVLQALQTHKIKWGCKINRELHCIEIVANEENLHEQSDQILILWERTIKLCSENIITIFKDDSLVNINAADVSVFTYVTIPKLAKQALKRFKYTLENQEKRESVTKANACAERELQQQRAERQQLEARRIAAQKKHFEEGCRREAAYREYKQIKCNYLHNPEYEHEVTLIEKENSLLTSWSNKPLARGDFAIAKNASNKEVVEKIIQRVAYYFEYDNLSDVKAKRVLTVLLTFPLTARKCNLLYRIINDTPFLYVTDESGIKKTDPRRISPRFQTKEDSTVYKRLKELHTHAEFKVLYLHVNDYQKIQTYEWELKEKSRSCQTCLVM